jgi:hypothetical protein
MKKLIASIFCAFALLAQLPAYAVDYYISDCATGAEVGCVAGNNAWNGLAPNFVSGTTGPKQNLSGFSITTMPAGTRFFFARGGSWAANTYGQIHNDNCTLVDAASGVPTTRECIVFDAYSPSWGGTNKPWLRGGAIEMFQIGRFSSPAETAGYVIRNLKLDGAHTTWRMAHVINSSHVVFEDNEILGFDGLEDTAPIQIDCTLTFYTGCNRFIIVRRNWFHDMVNIGAVLGSGNHMLVEANTIENVGKLPDPFAGHHCMYLGGHSKSMTVRGNLFKNCTSEGSGQNQGGNLTVHGHFEDLTIENNTFISDAGFGPQSIAISVTGGYDDAGTYTSGECFVRTVIRGNRIGTAQTAIDLNHNTNILIEGNLVQKVGGSGINWRTREGSANDCTSTGPTIRNNTFRIHNPNGSIAIATVGESPTGQSMDNNIVRFTGTGTGNYYAFNHPVIGSFTSFTNNSVTNAAAGGTFQWSLTYNSQAAATGASALWNANGDTSDPSFSASFTASPTSKAGFSCLLGGASPSRNTGNASRGSATSIDGRPWSGVMWKGACGPNN